MHEDVRGTTFYVDFERIKKHGGYVYYWDIRLCFKINQGGFSLGRDQTSKYAHDMEKTGANQCVNLNQMRFQFS